MSFDKSIMREDALALVVRAGAHPGEWVRVARHAGVPVIEVPADAEWDPAVLTDARRAPDDGELAALAQTIATLTGGLVTIEDTGSRVLAYSASTDEVDELRRRSILGRSGPPEYLALLRTWGVYDRLAHPDDVVEIAEHPESGIRPRLAVGVFAGTDQLGTIWVQQRGDAFAPHAERALLGAARVVAAAVVAGGSRGADPGDGGLAALLGGHSDTLPTLSRRAAGGACAVAVVELDAPDGDRAGRRLRLDRLAGILRVHAAALRAGALQTEIGGRLYLLVPDLDRARALVGALRTALAAAEPHLGCVARAAVGPVARGVAAAGGSRAGADLALERAGPGAVVAFDDVRPALLADAATRAVAERAHLHDPGLRALAADHPGRAETLRRYLESGSDVAAVAADLQLHPTTVRYRLRKITDELRLDLADADARLAALLQLRAGRGSLPGE